jgi:hypothetical protein
MAGNFPAETLFFGVGLWGFESDLFSNPCVSARRYVDDSTPNRSGRVQMNRMDREGVLHRVYKSMQQPNICDWKDLRMSRFTWQLTMVVKLLRICCGSLSCMFIASVSHFFSITQLYSNG